MGHRKVIGLFLNSAGLADDYQGELRSGVERAVAARRADLWVYAGRTDWSVPESGGARIFDLVDRSRLDGIILAAGAVASYAPLHEVIARLRRASAVPLCTVGQFCDGVPNVLVNNVTAVGKLVDHLVLAHDRKRFAYITGPVGHEESEQRLQATRGALMRHGLSLPDEAVARGDLIAYSARNAVQDLLARGVQMDALLAANDDMAAGAMEALRSAGTICPRDIAVAGFDDAAVARYCEPALTTVRQPVARLGTVAVECMMAILSGHEAADIVTVDTELVVRESCGCSPTYALSPRAEDPKGLLFTADEHLRALDSALAPLIDDASSRSREADALLRAVLAECAGKTGAFLNAFTALLGSLRMTYVPPHELQRSVSVLRSYARCLGGPPETEDAFHAARVLVGSLTYRSAGAQRLRSEYLLEELRLSSERLTTSLTMGALKDALLTELPRLGVGNALVALHPERDRASLELLAYLENGRHVELETGSYPSHELLPRGAFDEDRRHSLTILPLTFESERLGVAVLELPLGLEVYSLLREQIGSAVRNVLLHQAILKRERLHAKAQEDKRVTGERLRSMSIIAGGVAHDLNNILGPLVALPSTIQRELQSLGADAVPQDALQDLETIRVAGQRAAETIRDLRTFGSPEEGTEGAVDVNQILRGAERAFAALCGNAGGIELEIVTSSQPLAVKVSRTSLLRAVTNLVVNAVDAIDRVGRIVVRVGPRLVTTPIEGRDRVEAGSYVVIQVEDTGAGIPDFLLPRIFEPFFTAKRGPDPKGRGLGLAIVERIIKDSGGVALVDSQLGHGTTFSLFLPRVAGFAELPNVSPLTTGGRERLLVIDDEQVQLRTARRVLTQFGYSVTTVSSGEDAIALLSEGEAREPFALAIVDMVMPGSLCGTETIRELRKLNPRQKVLVASGCAPDGIDSELSLLRCRLVSKPYTPETLASAVRAVLDEPE